jgi:hypothetical protein
MAFCSQLRSYPWEIFYRKDCSVEEKCDAFYKAINTALSVIPFQLIPFTHRDKPWITPVIKDLINKRYEAYRSKNFELYNHYKTKVKCLIYSSKQKWSKNAKQRRGGLWKIANDVLNKNSAAPLASLIQGFNSTQEAANAFNKEFTQHFSDAPDWSEILGRLANLSDNDIWQPNITVQIVHKMLSDLDPRKAAGSDGLPVKLLRNASDVIAGPLTHLICLSLQTAQIPICWKSGSITPIPKCRAPSLKDLRPISNLPIFAKILEKCVLLSMKSRLVELYGKFQFGFRPHCSTLHAHLLLQEIVTSCLELKENSGVLLLSFDMRKAFDSLKHDCLMKSLMSGNLPKQFLYWCANFLTNRTQLVRLSSDVKSPFSEVTSGVPQGSVLSPFLFCVHMGSLSPYYDASTCIKYADDVMTVLPITRDASLDDIIHNEVCHMNKWCSTHGLNLNSSKTKIILFRKPNLSHPPVSSSLSLLSDIKLLGVTYQESLSFDIHVDCILKKASQRLYILRKLKPLLCKDDLLQLYHAFVLSCVEYCNPLLVGLNERNSDKIEKIRRKSHRIICGSECILDCLTPLKTRRMEQAKKTFLKMEQKDHILHDLFPERMRKTGRLRVPVIRSTRRLHSFLPYCTCLFNNLI